MPDSPVRLMGVGVVAGSIWAQWPGPAFAAVAGLLMVLWGTRDLWHRRRGRADA